VKNVTECVTVYQQKLSEISTAGWDQDKYQKLLDWYQKKIAQLTAAPSTTAAESSPVTDTQPTSNFPKGIDFGGKLFLKIFL
jgi:hypothetical protein